MKAERLDHIVFRDVPYTDEIPGQVVAGPFYVSDINRRFYYVVEPNGDEVLVDQTNILSVQECKS